MLASVHFGGYSKTSMLRFRKQLSHELIYNTYIPQTDEREPRRSPRNELESTHKVCAQPRGKKFLAPKWLILRSITLKLTVSAVAGKGKSGHIASALLVLSGVMIVVLNTFLRQEGMLKIKTETSPSKNRKKLFV